MLLFPRWKSISQTPSRSFAGSDGPCPCWCPTSSQSASDWGIVGVILLFWKLSVLIFLKSAETKLLLTVALLATSSCSIFKNNINSEQTYLSVEIFQTLSKDSALALTTGWDYDVVMIITSEDVYYDGKKISGTFVLVDTYTYESKGSGIKTVPVYRRKSEIR